MASMSKRAQARTEKELHELLRVPGNTTCADCGARNPSWASWNLGVFLCMRCASLHRKLGTHISKVKSLSMDTWTPDQVETMKKNGNLSVNKMYNPKNKRPDMPLDADEVDGAMERFIRKKYQEKSLSDGKPEVPTRDDTPPLRSKSPDLSPPPTLPSKKGRFFGFGLRASSSAYPLSKHDKKNRNEPRVDSTFRISSENYTTSGSSRAELSDHDLQLKLAQLRDMGFDDNERNTNVLKRHNGDLERSIASLVKLGPAEQTSARRAAPTPTVSTNVGLGSTAASKAVSAPQSATSSLNPFGQPDQLSGFGLSYGGTEPSRNVSSTNPWQTSIPSQAPTGIEQSFANLQVSQPLFPNTTGGYPGPSQHASQPSPHALTFNQSQSMTSSPVSMNNPFMQAPMSAHSTGSNPYASHMQPLPAFAPSTNPFLQAQPNVFGQQPSGTAQSYNPFGLPPTNSPPQAQSQPMTSQPQPSIFDAQPSYAEGSHNSMYGAPHFSAQQQFPQFNGPQNPPAFPNFQYGQPQSQPVGQQQQLQQQQQQQQPQQPQQPFVSQQRPQNPYFQQQPQSPPPQAQYQYQQQPAVQQQNQPLMPQQTGLMDKRSILALYNYPQLAPSKPLASIPEPTDESAQFPNRQQQQQQQQQTVSPVPSSAVYGGNNSLNPAKRSATMPASSMHSAGGTGSRNPFLSSTNTSTSSIPSPQPQQYAGYPQGTRHASHESMIVNNHNLQDGRHSPDAFASLSARFT